MKQPASILVIQTAFIGDVILATALNESLHAAFPNAAIDMLVRKGNESLLAGHPFLRETLVFDKSQKYKNLFRLIQRIRSSKYDLVVNAQRFATTGIITVLSGAGSTVGFAKNPLSILFGRRVPHHLDGRHETARNLDLIQWLPGVVSRRPALYPSAVQFDRVTPYRVQPYITVSPASVWFTKQFPASKWIDFLKQLPSKWKVYLLGAPQDAALCDQIATESGRQVEILAGKLSLLESAALMQGAAMNYVNDSAPMHLASAMNAPVCAVFCSTVPGFGFGPLSDQSHVIESADALDCRPCGLHGHRACPKGHFACAQSIDIRQLTELLR